ncbi:deleted in malignant brain tumors 1 protein [Mytilus galloprovincialis]|uniref:Deleted in malignant brain tumors 1 protein n=1 Tax=Mytilus galloprovincialis TaxID=29158 RepID=A0A8B6F308_MYTGA|nr:deleted in malignant brain tumors 1 protein [Mytilus galloprovincialis]
MGNDHAGYRCGTILFENIYEDRYTVYAKAEGHSTYSAIIIATPYTTIRDIFLQRTAVTYTWTVTPTTVEDKYEITLDSTFETFVPMPVVTIEPNKLDTVPFETEERESVDFTITNHGLIRADNLRFYLPTGHPTLQFQSTVDVLGDLAANTSIIIPVKITLKPRTKRQGSCSMLLVYDYICGGTRSNSASVILTGSCSGGGNIRALGSAVGGPWPGMHGVVIVYYTVTPVPCRCLLTVLKKCILAFLPWKSCIPSTGKLPTVTIALCALKGIVDIVEQWFKPTEQPKLLSEVNVVFFIISLRCLYALYKECGNKRERRDVSSEVADNVLFTSKPMNNYIQMMEEIYEKEEMFNVSIEWYPAFKTVISDDSESGSKLSKEEKSFVLNTLRSNLSIPILNRFLERWNNTVSAWNNGTLYEVIRTGRFINLSSLSMMWQQYTRDTTTANERGFDSIFSDFDHALTAYVVAEIETQVEGSSRKDNAICAKVRVRIVQDLVLTRDAFNARFEIENGENTALESIHVQIEIRKISGSEIVNDLFSIGNPNLLGLTGVDGDGRLGVDLSGSAEWLIIPYSIAAPNDDVLYNVGGRLSYRVGESNFSVPLLPDSITVKPNPSLVLHYFHEKYVRGDDPLTAEKEPVIPFTLAVMVKNSGYGVARALKISSAQPQIIENEKGLLITFRIIGGFLGNKPISPSLIVDFGDIKSFETKTARWKLTSTLQGTFYNFSATFENINPLGDPQLSLFENVWYHELIHLVRLFRDGQDDGFDDFLVNDFVDSKGIPEKVYNSANGSDVYDVMTATELGLSSSTFVKSNMKTYTLLYMEVLTKTSNWFYARVKNDITSPQQSLLSVRSDDNRDIVVDKNIWTTTHILDSFLLHLFDFIESNNSVSEEIEIKYVLTFGPKNMHPPKFNETSYSITLSTDNQIGLSILTVHAYDLDKNEITFEIIGFENETFAIDSHTGVVTLLNIPLAVGVFELQIICRDDGIPSLSGVVKVNINVISGERITTTLITYSETSAPISVTSQPKNSVSDKTTIPANSSGALDMTTKLSDDKTTEQDTSTGVVYATTNSMSDETTYHDTSKVVVDTTSKSSFGKTTEQDTSTYSIDAITGSPGTNIPEPDTSEIVVDSSTQSSSDRKTEPAISSGKVDATTKSSTTVDRFTSNNAVDMTSKSSFRKTNIPHSTTTAFRTTLGTSSAVKQASHILFLIVSNVLILSLKLIN